MKSIEDIQTTPREDRSPRSWTIPPEVVFLTGLPVIAGPAGQQHERSPLERLLDAFEAHIASEADSIATYRQLSESTTDPVVALLTRLIVADEAQHHRLLERMATTLRDDLNWTHSPDALPAATGEHDEKLLELTRALADQERHSGRELRALARQQRHAFDGLFELLLEVMAMDSDKHERILRFLARRMESRR